MWKYACPKSLEMRVRKDHTVNYVVLFMDRTESHIQPNNARSHSILTVYCPIIVGSYQLKNEGYFDIS